MRVDQIEHFNTETHLLRDQWSQQVDALIQWHLAQIDKLRESKANVRKATDPVCGLPMLQESLDDEALTQRVIAAIAPRSRGDTEPTEADQQREDAA